MSDRTFTLDEAQALLPVLESLLRAAIQAKKLMDEVDAEMQALHHRIFLNGGMFLEVLPLARRKGERTRAEQGAKDALAEIDSMGVQVKDLGRFSCVGSWGKKLSRTGMESKTDLPGASLLMRGLRAPRE